MSRIYALPRTRMTHAAARTLIDMGQLRERQAARALLDLQRARERRAAARALADLRHAQPEAQCAAGKRPPNETELRKGIPANFCVEEVPRSDGTRVDKYYYSPAGKRYRSVTEVKEAMERRARLRTFVFDFNQKKHTWKE